MKTTEIEKRLAAIEQDIANLKLNRTAAPKRHPVQTLEAIHGSFENDDAFKSSANGETKRLTLPSIASCMQRPDGPEGDPSA
jgi:hypothetical protein